MNKTGYDIAWLAGLFDGEGYAGFKTLPRKQPPTPRCAIRMTHKDTLERAYRICKAAGIGCHLSKQHPPSHKHKQPQWALAVDGHLRCRSFLELLFPHLTTKEQQAMSILAFIYSRTLRCSGTKRSAVGLSETEANLVEFNRRVNAESSGRRIPREHTSDWTYENVQMICSELHRDMQRCLEIDARLVETAKAMYQAGEPLAAIASVTGKSTTWIYSHAEASRNKVTK